MLPERGVARNDACVYSSRQKDGSGQNVAGKAKLSVSQRESKKRATQLGCSVEFLLRAFLGHLVTLSGGGGVRKKKRKKNYPNRRLSLPRNFSLATVARIIRRWKAAGPVNDAGKVVRVSRVEIRSIRSR